MNADEMFATLKKLGYSGTKYEAIRDVILALREELGRR